MSKDIRDAIELAMENVKPSRRELLKRLLSGGGAMMLVPTSSLVEAGQAAPGAAKGKGKQAGKGTPSKKKGKKKDAPPSTPTPK